MNLFAGIEVSVPRAAVGVVIGKGGDMIKKIQAETGARVQFQQVRDDGPGDRRCLLTGKPQHVEMARQRIEELIDSVIVSYALILFRLNKTMTYVSIEGHFCQLCIQKILMCYLTMLT